MSEKRVRLFVALELPAHVRAAIDLWRARVLDDHPELRPVQPRELHVTLCFLGCQEAREIESIGRACGILNGQPCAELALGEPVWLSPRRPRLLALKFDDPEGSLAALQSMLSEVLWAGRWYLPEARPFLAHATVARIAKHAPTRPVPLPAPPPLRVSCEAITLYHSHLSPTGARYEALHTVSLGSAKLKRSG